ncbi:MAG: hypothetical protein KJ601_05020 [Nanoarchaeota archaeon]|nr:hypothetical protein [Nanoarchaeota archaeon]
MKKNTFNKLVNVGILLFIVVVSFLLFGGNKQVQISSDYEGLAACLTEKGAVLYGTNWCGHCQNQKSMFGDSVKEINFVDCEDNSALCSENGIRGYPTWKIDGRMYEGEQQLSTLKQVSGC